MREHSDSTSCYVHTDAADDNHSNGSLFYSFHKIVTYTESMWRVLLCILASPQRCLYLATQYYDNDTIRTKSHATLE